MSVGSPGQPTPGEAWDRYLRESDYGADIARHARLLLDASPFRAAHDYQAAFRPYASLLRGGRLLEAGCGTGFVAFSAAIAYGCRVTLLDYSADALRRAKALHALLATKGVHIDAEFVQGDVERLPFGPVFDAVVNEGVIEHWLEWNEQLEIVQQMTGCVRPGGVAMIWVPNAHHPFYRMTAGVPDEAPPNPIDFQRLLTAAGLTGAVVVGRRAFRSPFVYSTLGNRFESLGLLVWAAEKLLPRQLRTAYERKFGYQLLGIGHRPAVNPA